MPTQVLEAPVSKMNLPETPLILATISKWLVSVNTSGMRIYALDLRNFLSDAIVLIE